MTVHNGSGVTVATSFPPKLESVSSARQWICAVLSHLPVDVVKDAELLTSEIVTNAIRHGRGEVGLKLIGRNGYQRFEVYDKGSDKTPQARTSEVPDSLSEGGWGLQILEHTASSCGTERTSDGSRLVWYELQLPTNEAAPAGVSETHIRSLDQDLLEV